MSNETLDKANLVELIQALGCSLLELRQEMQALQESVLRIQYQKDWYSTSEVADLMKVTRHTVQERWCNQGRIECEKDSQTGKWRIPGSEYDRLRKGGRPLPT